MWLTSHSPSSRETRLKTNLNRGLGQELKQRPGRNAAHWLASSALLRDFFSYTVQAYMPRDCTPHIGLGSLISISN